MAFVRGEAAITIVPRLVLGLAGQWGDTTIELPAGRWRDELTGDAFDGGSVRLADVLRRFPVALLARDESAA